MKSLALAWLVLAVPLAAQTWPLADNGTEPECLQPLASFRVTFGLQDEKPKAWDGRVRPEPGQSLQVEEDQFRNHDFGDRADELSRKSADYLPPLPNDRVVGAGGWICSTRWAPLHIVVRDGPPPTPILQRPSLLIHLRSGALDQPIHVQTPAGDFRFKPRDIDPSHAAYFLGGSVRVAEVPRVSGACLERLGQQDFPSMLAARDGGLWVAWQEYIDETNNDSLVVRRRSGGRWDAPQVLVRGADLFHTALAEDAQKRVWVVWSMQVRRNWDLYGCFYDGSAWSKPQQLTDDPSPDIYHQLVTDTAGGMWLVWQRNQPGYSRILAKRFDGQAWSAEREISGGPSAAGDNWWPQAAAGAGGSLAIVWDGYAAGSYDVFLRRWDGTAWGDVRTVAGTARFEAHPTVAVDRHDRIWVAWDESGVNWGKDTGFLVIHSGTRLHASRRIQVVCLDGGRWMTPQDDLSRVLPTGPIELWELPHLQIDAAGLPCLFVRHMVPWQPNDIGAENPRLLALWEIVATRYEGGRWSDPMPLPRSNGRNDMMPSSALTRDGGLWAVWPTDLRNTKGFMPHQLEVQLGHFPRMPGQAAPVLKADLPEPAADAPIHPHEAEEVARIRGYRIHALGRTYSIFRGDLHRHTDISVDGNNDGSLLDAYRYARDAAKLDFVGIADHTDGITDPYVWWRSQKVADLFQIRDTFAAFYGYERSVQYPNGHRNIFFIRRGGASPMDIYDAELSGDEGPERLYWYLRRHNGFSIPHTTGRSSGTDWRMNDPKVENLLEIYQGERDAYEYSGAPHPFRLWSQWLDPNRWIPISSSQMNSASTRRLGFAWEALEKGYKLGFIASSDHLSAHVSYACLIAEHLTLPSLLQAVRARRSYAATDNIILDVHAWGSDGKHLPGDIFESAAPVRIAANVLGTGDILQVDIIKDEKIVKTYKPGAPACRFEYADPDVRPGDSHYYVRVIQANGEMAWGSPVWVTYRG